MAGKYVRPLGYMEDDENEHEKGEIQESEYPALAENSHAAGKINPLALVDQFPEDPTFEIARDFWIDWIQMMRMMFQWNAGTFTSDAAKLSILLAKGGGFIRKILSNKWEDMNFDGAVETIENYFRVNSNSLADEAIFRRITQEKTESFEKFADRVTKKARVFGISDEKRIIAQVTAGALEVEKLTDYSIRGDVTLSGILAYGNQIEALARSRETNVLPKEVNEMITSCGQGRCNCNFGHGRRQNVIKKRYCS